MIRAGATRRGPLAVRVSGGWFPPAGSVFYADFQLGRYFWGGIRRALTDFNFTRSTTGTFIGSNGLLQTAAIDVPRIEANGLLIERSATNLALRSNEFNNATTWQTLGTAPTITPNADTGPDGTLSASQFSLTATATLYQEIAVSASTTYTLSFWAKRGTATANVLAVFNVTGASDILSSSFHAEINASTYTRVTRTFTTPAGCTAIRIFPTRNPGVTGTTFFYGAQLETGEIATSYIPTVAATVTRAADDMRLNGLAARGITLANPVTVGNTLFSEYRKLQADTGFPHIIEMRDAVVGSRWRAFHLGNNDVRTNIVAGFTGQGEVSIGTGSGSPNLMKMAFRVQQGDSRGYINGSSTSGTAPALVETADILLVGNGDQPLHGIVKSVTIYNSGFNNTQLAALTS